MGRVGSVSSVQSVYVYLYTRNSMYQWLQSTTIVWVVYSLSMCISIPGMVCTSGYNQPMGFGSKHMGVCGGGGGQCLV